MKNLYKIAAIGIFLFLGSCNNQDTDKSENKEIENKFIMPKDAHSFAKPEAAVVEHIHLDLEVNFETKVLSGTAKLDIKNMTGTDKLYLDSKGLIVDKAVLDNGEATMVEQGEGIELLGSPLIVHITPETRSVTLTYKTSPNAEAIMWMEGSQTASGKPFMFTQSQAILARTWYPCQDSPGVKFTYSAKITVPKGLMAVMSAENGTAKTEDGVYTFNMPQKVNSYLVALAVGDIEFKELGRNSGVYAEPTMLEKSAYEFADLQNMIDAAESIYGEYVWGRYDVLVLPASFPFGGMENPRLTFATPTIIAGDRSLVSLVAHELAHSWSGNLVTNATWDDFWLNEGFTVYFEDRIMEKLYGKEYSDMLTKLGYDELVADIKTVTDEHGEEDTHLKLKLIGRNPDDGMTSIAYEKGRFFLTTIEEAVGREKWDAFVKQYFSEFKFQSMTTERFLDYLNKELIKGDKALEAKIDIDAWVYGPGIPATCPEIRSRELEKVEAAAESLKRGGKAADIDTAGWTTHHINHFLRNLPDSLSLAQLKDLDAHFKFTRSGNSEILCDWFKHTIPSKYEEANPALAKFLINVGRRKFLTPLYTRLAKTPEQKAWAIEVYKKARPTYHSVAYNTIDGILGYQAS